MEKMNEKNRMNDADLEEVNGGGKLFDIFTTEFKEFFNGSDDQNNPLDSEKINGNFGVTTLEMRVEPNKNKKANKKNVMKL